MEHPSKAKILENTSSTIYDAKRLIGTSYGTNVKKHESVIDSNEENKEIVS